MKRYDRYGLPVNDTISYDNYVQFFEQRKHPSRVELFDLLRQFQENPKLVQSYGIQTIRYLLGLIGFTRRYMTGEEYVRFNIFEEELKNERDLLYRAGYGFYSDEPYKYVKRIEVIRKPCFLLRLRNYIYEGTPLTCWEEDEERIAPDLRIVMEEERKQKKRKIQSTSKDVPTDFSISL